MQPRSSYIQLNFYEVHYTEWGLADAPPLILWHGLSRTGRSIATGHARSCPDR